MSRLDRIIKGFNDYDNLVRSLMLMLDEKDSSVAESKVNNIRDEIGLLIGELKRHGCRRQN